MSNAPNLPPDQLLELLLTLKKTTPTAARTILNGQPAIAYGLISLMVQMNAIDLEVFQKTLAGYQGSAAATRPASVPNVPPAASQPPSHMGPPSSHSSTPVPAIPPHMQQAYQGQYRTSTPPGHPPPHSVSQTPPFAPAAVPPPAAYASYPASNGYSGVSAPPASGPPSSTFGAPPPGLSGGPPGGAGYPPGLSSQGPPYGGYGPPPARGYGNGPPPTGGPPPHMQQHPPVAPAIPGLSPELTATLAALGDEQKALIMRVISMSPEQIRALPPQERSTYVQIRATFGIATPGG